MEPLAHTLAGACLAETGLKRLTPLATSTLLIAANLPDVDGACYLHSADLAFGFRRGLTHGIVAMAALPVLLTLVMLAFDRTVRRRWKPCEAPARARPLLLLSVVGVLSHPFLDWLNNYGVRLLMPFSDRWFYGDALFIVDPWLWLILGGAVMLAWTTHRPGVLTWIVITAGATLLLVLNPLVPFWARMTWLVAIATWLMARILVPEHRRPRVAGIALAVALAYIGAMIAGSRVAESQVRAWARDRGVAVMRVAAMPTPADPLMRTVIVVMGDRYLFVPVDWTRGPDATATPGSVPIGEEGRAVHAALAAPFVQGVRRWLRFPSYEVRTLPNGGQRVIIRDARFMIGNLPGFGVVAIVDLDASLTPRPGPRLSG
ncbi:MAG: metal-dependent hydrolase [Acidobacteria bacterium]|nr:metal-dependent hydrolase [Acidobacteriota bacterium]